MNVPTLPGPTTAGPTSAPGRAGAANGGEAPTGFTAMLVDALAGEVSSHALTASGPIDPDAITELAAALEELAPTTEEAAETEGTDGQEAAEALAAALLAGSSTRPELAAAVRAWHQQASGTGESAESPVPATPPTTEPGDAAPIPGATVTATDTEQLPAADMPTAPASRAAASPSTGATVAAETPAPGDPAQGRPATTPVTPTLPAAAAERARQAVAEAPARVSVDGGEAPTPPPAANAPSASTTAPAGAATPAPTGPDTSLHARIVSRVIQAAEALEHAPPPRTMVVELPDGEGMRLQVSLRGTEVHVQVQGGAGAGTDLGAWSRELSAGLAGRGLSLGEFQTGADADRGRDQDHPAPDDLPAPDDRAPHRAGRRGTTDGALRL